MFAPSKISVPKFAQKIGSAPNLVLDYNIIKNALRNIKLESLDMGNASFYFQSKLAGKLGRRFFYAAVKQVESPLCVNLWNRKYGFEINRLTWQ